MVSQARHNHHPGSRVWFKLCYELVLMCIFLQSIHDTMKLVIYEYITVENRFCFFPALFLPRSSLETPSPCIDTFLFKYSYLHVMGMSLHTTSWKSQCALVGMSACDNKFIAQLKPDPILPGRGQVWLTRLGKGLASKATTLWEHFHFI